MSIALTAALLALQAAAPPGPGPWVEVGEELGGRYFVDPARLRRDGDLIFFPVRLEVNPPQDGVIAAEGDYVINCRRRTYGTLSVTLRGPDASALRSRSGSGDLEGTLLEPFDDSMIEARMMRRLCGAGSR